MSASTCPYCMSRIHSHEVAVKCRACGTRHHSECWEDNGGCCAKDCAERRSTLEIDIPPDTDEKLVLSRGEVESARPHRPTRHRNPCMSCGKELPEGELHCAECQPKPQENQDVRNAGPLVVIALLALLIAWALYSTIGEQPSKTSDNPNRATRSIDEKAQQER